MAGGREGINRCILFICLSENTMQFFLELLIEDCSLTLWSVASLLLLCIICSDWSINYVLIMLGILLYCCICMDSFCKFHWIYATPSSFLLNYTDEYIVFLFFFVISVLHIVSLLFCPNGTSNPTFGPQSLQATRVWRMKCECDIIWGAKVLKWLSVFSNFPLHQEELVNQTTGSTFV